MSIPRLHCDSLLSAGALVTASAAQAHHLRTVLRRRAGDPVRLFNARDGEWSGRIIELGRDQGRFAVDSLLRPPAPEQGFTLLPACLKREAMEWLIEKATELGASRIQPVLTQRSVVQQPNLDRLALIARGAAEQCERLSLPAILPPLPLPALLAAWQGGGLLVAVERSSAPPLPQLAGHGRALMTGPEGGFTAAELDELRRHPFVTPCSLGPRILRAETAAIAGLAVLQALAGDWAGDRT
ncbi:MAG: 16S rRNA (uracil(1498)-N(3))-methyltransferase [Rhodovarius sp.]|nr:16S rRNA (uracil(1498)-N(3))-methyltransferase [Rhodovarius sp.]